MCPIRINQAYQKQIKQHTQTKRINTLYFDKIKAGFFDYAPASKLFDRIVFIFFNNPIQCRSADFKLICKS